MAKLARERLSLRRIEQDDDPIHAKVTYANYATRGFALNDVLAYAWRGTAIGSFVQNQFRRTGALKAFCEKHGFVTLLQSVCDRDVTSDRPICLYKETAGGGLFVLDVEPCESEASTFSEPVLAVHLLLSILGQAQHSLGQYTIPVEDEAELRDTIREMDVRFEHFVVHDADLPVDEVVEQLVTIGRDDESLGRPLKPKPVVLVRSGLTTGDVESVYGSLLWFKQFVRMEPHRCPYIEQLASQFRLAWIPLAAPWAEPAEVKISGLEDGPYSGTVSCAVNVRTRTKHYFGQTLWLLDGRIVGKGDRFEWDTATVANGVHLLRAVVSRTGLIRTQAFAVKTVDVRN
jgi:hypothetical protein